MTMKTLLLSHGESDDGREVGDDRRELGDGPVEVPRPPRGMHPRLRLREGEVGMEREAHAQNLDVYRQNGRPPQRE